MVFLLTDLVLVHSSIMEVKLIYYKYETHLHTSESSACGRLSGATQARIYKELGYSGIIVTDHFFGGNTAVKRNLPWKESVDRFVRGYENAKKEGDRIGLSVFFGFEESFSGTDFLVYGLEKEWLYENPDILHWNVKEYYENVHKGGGIFVHAHPFREACYINEIRLYNEYENAIEIVNRSHKDPLYNEKAKEYAILYNKAVTEGSDAHKIDDIHGGMLFDHELVDSKDFIASVMNKNCKLMSEEI